MMSYEEAVQVLEEMRSRYHAGFSSRDKEVIERLYETVLSMNFRKTSFGDCYRDSYLELFNYLKKSGKMEERKYKLRRGVLLRPEFGSSEFYSAKSITDEKAEELDIEGSFLITRASLEAIAEDKEKGMATLLNWQKEALGL